VSASTGKETRASSECDSNQVLWLQKLSVLTATIVASSASNDASSSENACS
jgi:hypothetical protein